VADQPTLEAIEATDTDQLLRIIERHCKSRSWDSLLELRQLCAHALVRGKQLWGVDEHIRYRLALEAPPRLAAGAVEEGPARFTLGPLTEVVACHHTFQALDPHLGLGPDRTWIAHERVIRGEVIDPDRVDSATVELPLNLSPWEGSYSLARYQADRVEADLPRLPTMDPVTPSGAGEPVEDPASVAALEALVAPWVEESNGRVVVASVAGDLGAALGVLGVRRAQAGPIDLATAMSLMAWAAASGGAHGRRRGGAAGRLAAWWALTQLTGLPWPPSPSHLGEAGRALAWFAWSDLGEGSGWNLHLAATSSGEGLTWAMAATDAV
jgi:hypothetical protein